MSNYESKNEFYQKHSGVKSNIGEFVTRANIVHKHRYNYSLSFYKNHREPVIIYCFMHGFFKQAPQKHLNGSGCTKCSLIAQGRRRALSNDEFIKKANLVHSLGVYDYSKSLYIKAKNKVIITCRKHGDFQITPNKHLGGQGCSKCGLESRGKKQTRTQISFINEATMQHDGKFDYSKSVYKRSHEKLIIICRDHGEFKQTPASHLQGIGCPKCGFELTAWNKSAYTACAEINGKSCVYLIKCFSDDESFYKIGITSTDLNYRFKKSKMPYSFIVISTKTEGASADWDNEKKLHRNLKKFRYKPLVSFGGETECFSELTNEVKDFFGVEK